MNQYTERHLQTLAVGHLTNAGRQMSYFGHNPYNNSPVLLRHFYSVTRLGAMAAHVAEANRLVGNM